MLREGGGQLVSVVLQKALSAQWASRHFFPEDQVQFGPSVMHPEKIICVGMNYRKHAAETGSRCPSRRCSSTKLQHR